MNNILSKCYTDLVYGVHYIGYITAVNQCMTPTAMVLFDKMLVTSITITTPYDLTI